MDSHIFSGISKFRMDAGSGKTRRDDDVIDRLSHTFTAILLLIFTLVISTRQYIGKPIACWVPTEFTRAQEEYAENVCWVTNTYFLPARIRSVPDDFQDRESRRLGYYQWVPFLLMIQAFLFNLPCLMWRLFNWQSGVQLANIMEVACEVHMIRDPSTRRSTIAYLSRYIQDTLWTPDSRIDRSCSGRCRRCLSRCSCLWLGRYCGNYLMSLYLLVKWLYIVNCLSQFYIMNRYLGTNYTLYGLELLQDVARGYMWQESGHFPRVTLCDFEIRRLGNIHRHTVQCVLPINMFNEKIYIFLWFWLLLLTLATFSSFMLWFSRAGLSYARFRFVRKFLKLREVFSPGDRRRCDSFVDSFLRADGVFILRLIEQNAGQLVTAEVIERLWVTFKKQNSRELTANSQWEVLANKKIITEASPTDRTSSSPQPMKSSLRCVERPPRPPLSSSTVKRGKKHFSLSEDDPGEFV